MAFLHVVAVFEHMTGVSEDRVMNTWAFQTPTTAPVAGEMDDVAAALEEFYNDVIAATSHTVAHYIGEQLSRSADDASFEFYDVGAFMSGAPHGSPIRIDTWTLGATNPGADGIPSELAVCLSYHGNLTGIPEESGLTRPRARRRGRVYIGPLSQIALESEAGTGRSRVATQCRDTIAAAGGRLADHTDVQWNVWSRSDSAFTSVTGGFVDDAFDVQRRRGEDAVARSTF